MIHDCIVAPPLTHNFTESVLIKGDNIVLQDVKVESPVALDCFATCSSSSDVQFSDCKFNDEFFNDPPESKHVQRY